MSYAEDARSRARRHLDACLSGTTRQRPAGRFLRPGRLERVRKLVLRSDLDDFPRYIPIPGNLGDPAADTCRFDVPASYALYWTKLLGSHSFACSRARVLKLRVAGVGDEWHLLNGAWWEHDEADISWINAVPVLEER